MVNRQAIALNQTPRPSPEGAGLRPRLDRLPLSELRDDLARHEVHVYVVGDALVLRTPDWAPAPGRRP